MVMVVSNHSINYHRFNIKSIKSENLRRK